MSLGKTFRLVNSFGMTNGFCCGFAAVSADCAGAAGVCADCWAITYMVNIAANSMANRLFMEALLEDSWILWGRGLAVRRLCRMKGWPRTRAIPKQSSALQNAFQRTLVPWLT